MIDEFFSVGGQAAGQAQVTLVRAAVLGFVLGIVGGEETPEELTLGQESLKLCLHFNKGLGIHRLVTLECQVAYIAFALETSKTNQKTIRATEWSRLSRFGGFFNPCPSGGILNINHSEMD